MIGWYDRQGKRISAETAMSRLEAERRVAKTQLSHCWISTVWLGLDHRHGTGPPIIFETMVFSEDGESLDCARYSTEAEAKKGHDAMTKKWKREETT